MSDSGRLDCDREGAAVPLLEERPAPEMVPPCSAPAMSAAIVAAAYSTIWRSCGVGRGSERVEPLGIDAQLGQLFGLGDGTGDPLLLGRQDERLDALQQLCARPTSTGS